MVFICVDLSPCRIRTGGGTGVQISGAKRRRELLFNLHVFFGMWGGVEVVTLAGMIGFQQTTAENL